MRTNERRNGRLALRTSGVWLAWLDRSSDVPGRQWIFKILLNTSNTRSCGRALIYHHRHSTGGARPPTHQQVPPALIQAAGLYNAAPLTCQENTGGVLGILGLMQLNPLWDPLALLPLIHSYAVLGKKSASAGNSYVTDPYPACLDGYICNY